MKNFRLLFSHIVVAHVSKSKAISNFLYHFEFFSHEISNEELKVVKYFSKEVPSWIFDRVLNMHLIITLNYHKGLSLFSPKGLKTMSSHLELQKQSLADVLQNRCS